MARNQRRTNWIGYHLNGTDATTSPGAYRTFALADPTDATSEISKYVDPTIVRIRGHVLADPVITPVTLTPQFCRLWFILHVGEAAYTTWITDTNAALSKDGILWTGGYGIHYNADQSTAVGFTVQQGSMQSIEFDVRAMRKLEDDRALFFTIMNHSDSTVDCDVAMLARVLVKE